jgi:hypothetical protein
MFLAAEASIQARAKERYTRHQYQWKFRYFLYAAIGFELNLGLLKAKLAYCCRTLSYL